MWACAVSLGSLSLYRHALCTFALLCCGGVSVCFLQVIASLIGWRCGCRNEWARVPFVIITNVSNTVSGSVLVVGSGGFCL